MSQHTYSYKITGLPAVAVIVGGIITPWVVGVVTILRWLLP